jgi:hypothetical protein
VDKKRLKQTVGEILEGGGFLKKGQTWYSCRPEVIGVLELQKSDWADHYYLNIGFFIRSLDPSMEFPPERLCHLRYRADSIFDDLGASMDEMLSLGDSETDSTRAERLKDLLTRRVQPLFGSVRTVSDLASHAKAPWFLKGFVHVKARPLLGLS